MRTWTLVVSVCVHAAIVAAIVVSPILATTDLPEPRRPLTFETITAVEVPSEPVAPRPQPVQPSPAPTPSFPVTEPPTLPPDTAPVPVEPETFGVPGGNGVSPEAFAPVGDPVIAPPPAPLRRDPYPVGRVIRPPTRVVYVQPVYPRLAIDARKEGTVILQAVIDESGNVREVKVLRSIPLLDDAAIQAVTQWKFTPTMLNGMPVPVMMTVTVGFILKP